MEVNSIGSPQPNLTTNVQAQAAEQATAQASNGNLAQEASQLTSSAETALASVFFSLLQNILSEAQSNSGS